MIDREQVKKVAHLARLDITPDEEAEFTGQLNDILGYFEQLSELDTENVAPTTRAIEVINITRSDELEPFPHKDALLASAPEQEGQYFRVPKIMASEDN